MAVSFSAMVRLIGRLPGFVSDISDSIHEAAKDGKITPEEGESIARSWSRNAGDVLRIRVKKKDVVGPKAQEDLAGGLGRIIARIVNVTTGDAVGDVDGEE